MKICRSGQYCMLHFCNFYDNVNINIETMNIENMVNHRYPILIHDIMYRSIVSKHFPNMYNKIKILESFDYDNFKSRVDSIKRKNGIFIVLDQIYGTYVLDYEIIYNLFTNSLKDSNVDKLNGYLSLGENIITTLYKNLVRQNNRFKILEVLISEDDVSDYIYYNVSAIMMNPLGESTDLIDLLHDKIYKNEEV